MFTQSITVLLESESLTYCFIYMMVFFWYLVYYFDIWCFLLISGVLFWYLMYSHGVVVLFQSSLGGIFLYIRVPSKTVSWTMTVTCHMTHLFSNDGDMSYDTSLERPFWQVIWRTDINWRGFQIAQVVYDSSTSMTCFSDMTLCVTWLCESQPPKVAWQAIGPRHTTVYVDACLAQRVYLFCWYCQLVMCICYCFLFWYGHFSQGLRWKNTVGSKYTFLDQIQTQHNTSQTKSQTNTLLFQTTTNIFSNSNTLRFVIQTRFRYM